MHIYISTKPVLTLLILLLLLGLLLLDLLGLGLLHLLPLLGRFGVAPKANGRLATGRSQDAAGGTALVGLPEVVLVVVARVAHGWCSAFGGIVHVASAVWLGADFHDVLATS